MYDGSIAHDDIIRAFRDNVPGVYVRDYRDKGGFIVLCKGFKNLPWRDQISNRRVYVQVPALTLANLPKGFMTPRTRYVGLKLDRTGWRQEFERASRHLTVDQMRAITDDLGKGEVFSGVR